MAKFDQNEKHSNSFSDVAYFEPNICREFNLGQSYAGRSELSSFIYQVDAIGNRTQVSTSQGNHVLGYDSDSQLISATNPEVSSSSNLQSEAFNYDAISNRIADQKGNFAYDSKSQRLIQDYNNYYFYDNNGNLISKQGKGLTGEVTQYSYSSENQLIAFKVYSPGTYDPSVIYTQQMNLAKEGHYVYDPIGRRIQKQIIDYTATTDPTKTFTRSYGYDGQNILLEFDGSNNLLVRYTHSGKAADDVLSANVLNLGSNQNPLGQPGTYQYLKDAQGTVTDVVDNSGNKIQHYIYSAFGMLLGIQNASAADVTNAPPLRTNFTFAGREQDFETGLYYNRARYYDPNIGRFLQKDPSPGNPGVPMSVTNAYIYAGNNPFNLSDPTGHSFLGSLLGGLVLGIAAVLTGGAAAALAISALGLTAGSFGAIAVGALVGAIAGGLAGGIVGGIENVIQGKSFAQGFWSGAIAGAFAGAMAGAFVGAENPAANGIGDDVQSEQAAEKIASDGTQTAVNTGANSGLAQSSLTDDPFSGIRNITSLSEDVNKITYALDPGLDSLSAPFINPLCIFVTIPASYMGALARGLFGFLGAGEAASIGCSSLK